MPYEQLTANKLGIVDPISPDFLMGITCSSQGWYVPTIYFTTVFSTSHGCSAASTLYNHVNLVFKEIIWGCSQTKKLGWPRAYPLGGRTMDDTMVPTITSTFDLVYQNAFGMWKIFHNRIIDQRILGVDGKKYVTCSPHTFHEGPKRYRVLDHPYMDPTRGIIILRSEK